MRGQPVSAAPTTSTPTTPGPTAVPTSAEPTASPTAPTAAPTVLPSNAPSTAAPTALPSGTPTCTPAADSTATVSCPTVETFCGAGTMVANGLCVPDCSDLRRRNIACPTCDTSPPLQGPATQVPGEINLPTTGATTVAAPNSGAGDTEDGGGSDGIAILGAVLGAIVLCIFVFIVRRQSELHIGKGDGGSASSARTKDIANPTYGQPGGSTDGFGFAAGTTDPGAGFGYLEVEAKK